MAIKKKSVAKKKVAVKSEKRERVVLNSGKTRFAILCRVSTEHQAKKGVSLDVQREMLIDYVELLGGVIPDVEAYVGRESSSPGQERKIFDKLLKDAASNKFDAVMFADATRIGRSKKVTEEAIEILRKSGIELYLGMRKYDLSNPQDEFILTVFSAHAQLGSDESTQKAFLSKVRLAKKGWCMQGKPPYGRVTKNSDKNEAAEWVIDPEAKKEIKEFYRLCVDKGLSFKEIAARFGTYSKKVSEHLYDANKTKFTQPIPYKRLGITKIFTTKVPRILTDKQVEEVRRRANAKRTFRESKRDYPLAQRVICGHCGSVLSGAYQKPTKGRKERSNYRHADAYVVDDELCVKNVNAEKLETAVFDKFGQILSQKGSLVKAIKQALVKTDSAKEELESELSFLNDKLKAQNAAHDNLYKKFMALDKASGPMFEKIKKSIDKGDKQIQDLSEQRDSVERELKMMVIKIPKDLNAKVAKYLEALTGISGHAPLHWTSKDKKKLAEFFFGKKGNGMGVHVRHAHDKEHGEYKAYEIKGLLGGGSGVVSDYLSLNDDGALNDESASGDVNIADLKKLIDSIEAAAEPCASEELSSR